MNDLRKSIGSGKLLTAATVSDAQYIDFRSCIDYLDMVNVMAYDMNEGDSTHHAALYSSDISGNCTSNRAVEAHLKAGVPKKKLVLGVPFYGKGHREDEGIKAFLKTGVLPEGYEQRWSEDSQVPYIVNAEGLFVWGYENVKSLSAKCQYILDHYDEVVKPLREPAIMPSMSSVRHFIACYWHLSKAEVVRQNLRSRSYGWG